MIELLVVMVVLGVFTALAMPMYGKLNAHVRAGAATRGLLYDLRAAHNEARTKQKTITVAFDTKERSYIYAGKKRFLPKEANISSEDTGIKLVQFFADGSATPAAIDLEEGNKNITIHVNGLTGHAR